MARQGPRRITLRTGVLLALVNRMADAGAASSMKIRGISYGLSPSEGDTPRNDDFFCDEAAPQWNESGRGDLRLIQALGANTVRLYGNDPRLNHSNFLDAADKLGLKVMPGNSDYPFMQAPDSCQGTTAYDCSRQVKDAYAQNLQHGFLREDGKYHPAISHLIVVNEPDMKLPSVSSPMSFTKAIISALDGMLEAEKEAGVDPAGGLPNFTVTFSWSICDTCGNWTDKPGLGQMWQLRDAMHNPSKYGYTAKNDLAEVYRTRFVNSFNTANPSFQMRPLFFDFYDVDFTSTPCFIAEYHWNNKGGNQEEDINQMGKVVAETPTLLGISYFEFAVRHDIGGHLDFGIFSPGVKFQSLAQMSYFGSDYGIHCLEPVHDAAGRSLPAQVARAFGGTPTLFEKGCLSAGGGLLGTVTTTTETSTSQASSTQTMSSSSAPDTSTSLPVADISSTSTPNASVEEGATVVSDKTPSEEGTAVVSQNTSSQEGAVVISDKTSSEDGADAGTGHGFPMWAAGLSVLALAGTGAVLGMLVCGGVKRRKKSKASGRLIHGSTRAVTFSSEKEELTPIAREEGQQPAEQPMPPPGPVLAQRTFAAPAPLPTSQGPAAFYRPAMTVPYPPRGSPAPVIVRAPLILPART